MPEHASFDFNLNQLGVVTGNRRTKAIEVDAGVTTQPKRAARLCYPAAYTPLYSTESTFTCQIVFNNHLLENVTTIRTSCLLQRHRSIASISLLIPVPSGNTES